MAPRRILHARQLHRDPGAPLLLDDRLRHTQFVDPLAQGYQVLADGIATDIAVRGLGQAHDDARLSLGLPRSDIEGAEIIVFDNLFNLFESLCITRQDVHFFAMHPYPAIADFLLAQ